MERELDLILQKLYNKEYAEAKEMSEGIKNIVLSTSLTDYQIGNYYLQEISISISKAYISSHIFDSHQNLFIFLHEKSNEKERDSVNLRRFLLETIAKYIKAQRDKVSDYLKFINDNCLSLFNQEISGMVKEASLRPIIKTLKYFDAPKIDAIFDCNKITNLLLNKIKLESTSAGVKACIFYIIGLLTVKFSKRMEKYQIEIQDVMYNKLFELLISHKPEQNFVAGLFKTFRLCLTKVHLTYKQIPRLYLQMKATIVPIPTVKRYGVPIQSLRLFATHHNVFKEQIFEDIQDLYEKFMQAISHNNVRISDEATAAFEGFIRELAVGFENNELANDKYFFLMKKFEVILNSVSSDITSLTIVIRSIAIFSKVIKAFHGEADLENFFSKITDLSKERVVNEFKNIMQNEHIQDNSSFFSFTGAALKQILSKQKMLYSFLSSFAILVENVRNIDDKEFNHLYELALIGFQYNLKFFGTYRESLYNGIFSLIKAMFSHPEEFPVWLNKLTSQALLETLKPPANVYFEDEDYHYSLKFTCELWAALINRPEEWSAACSREFFNCIMTNINELINNTDLSYRVQYLTNENQDFADSVRYVPNNLDDSQYMHRIILFLDEFIWKVNKRWTQNWISLLLKSTLNGLTRFPRCITLLKLLTTIHDYIEGNDLLSKENFSIQEIQDLCLNSYKELFEKYKEYQDELLDDSLKALLSIPTYFIVNEPEHVSDPLILALKKAFQLSTSNPYIAFSALNLMTRLAEKLPKKKVNIFLTYLTPFLSELLKPQKLNKEAMRSNMHKFNLKISETSINWKTVSDRALEFLGKIGGLNHLIVPTEVKETNTHKNLVKEFSDSRCLNNSISLIYDHCRSLYLTLPLYAKNIEINLAKIIPRVVKIASTSLHKKMKTAACELLHSLIIYLIGKSAQMSLVKQNNTSQNTFSNLYRIIFPAMLAIAVDSDEVPAKIFQALCMQITRLFSGSRSYETGDKACFLDILFECASTRDNSNLRNFAASCLGEFIRWSIKQMTQNQLQQNYGNIKSVIMRIEANANHSNIYNRYGAILSLKCILIPLRDETFLVSKYILELIQVILNVVKKSFYASYVPDEISTETKNVIKKLHEITLKRWDLLKVADQRRGGAFENIHAFIMWLYSQLMVHEKPYQLEILGLWEELSTKEGGTPKAWISKNIKQKNLFECKVLIFDLNEFAGNTNSREKINLVKRNYELLLSQIQVFELFLTKEYCLIEEIKNTQDFLIFVKNVNSFLVVSNQHSLEGIWPISNTQRDPFLTSLEIYVFLMVSQFISRLKNFDENFQIFLSNNFTKKKFSFRLFQALILPLEESGIQSNFYPVTKAQRIQISSDLLKKFPQDNLFEESFINHFLIKNKKLDLSSPSCLLSNITGYTELQISTILEGYTEALEIFSQKSTSLYKAFIRNTCTVVLDTLQTNIPTATHQSKNGKIIALFKFLTKIQPDINPILDLVSKQDAPFEKLRSEFLDLLAEKWANSPLITLQVLTRAAQNPILNHLLVRLLQRVIQTSNSAAVLPIARSFDSINLPLDSTIRINFTKFFYLLLSQLRGSSFLQTHSRFKKFLQKFLLDQLGVDNKDQQLVVHLKTINLLGLFIKELGDDNPEEISIHLDGLVKYYFPFGNQQQHQEGEEVLSLPKNTNNKIIEAFINMVIVASRVELLQVISPIFAFRESQNFPLKKFDHLCKSLAFTLAKLPNDKHPQIFTTMFSPLLLQSSRNNHPRDASIQVQIMSQIGLHFLEKISLPSLENIAMCHTRTFYSYFISPWLDPQVHRSHDTLFNVQYKTIIAHCFGIFYKRLSANFIKNMKLTTVENSPPTELHKLILLPLYQAKTQNYPHKNALLNTQNMEEVVRTYHCACYNTLCQILMVTQTKEDIFTNFLFKVNRDKGEQFWELILPHIQDFAFTVETNFSIIIPEDSSSEDLPIEDPSHSIITSYLSESLSNPRSAKDGFLIKEFHSSSVNHEGADPNDFSLIKEETTTTHTAFEHHPPPPKSLEVDKINQHPCMSTILKVIDFLSLNFPAATAWQDSLFDELTRVNAPLYIKIFIIKIILNKEEIFQSNSEQWGEVLIKYCSLEENGGKGFHYFLRDVCTTLISWHLGGFTVEESPENKKLCSQALSRLMRVACDKSSLIFKSNLKIISELMGYWRTNLSIDKARAQRMLQFDDKREDSCLWRFTALSLLDYALDMNIPLDIREEEMEYYGNWDHETVRLVANNIKFTGGDSQVPLLASTVCGKLLKYFHTIEAGMMIGTPLRLAEAEKLVLKFLMQDHDDFGHYLNKIMISYPHILQDRKLFLMCQNKIHTQRKSSRAALFDAIAIFFDKFPDFIKIEERTRDIFLSLISSSSKIMMDYDQTNLLSFLNLLIKVLQTDPSKDRPLTQETIDSLAKTYLDSSNEAMVEAFLNLANYLYTQNEHNLIKPYLFKSLHQPPSSIRLQIFDFLDKEESLSLNPTSRVLTSLTDLYQPSSQDIWLKSTAAFLLSTSKKSLQYSQNLFNFPLEQSLHFEEYDPNNTQGLGRFCNRSQPLTPLFTLSQQRISGIIQNTLDKSLHDPYFSKISFPFQGVRTTQNHPNMFSQTLATILIDDSNNSFKPSGTSENYPLKMEEDDNDEASISASDIVIKHDPFQKPKIKETPSSYTSLDTIGLENVSVLGNNHIRYTSQNSQNPNAKSVKAKHLTSLIKKSVSEIQRNKVVTSRKYRIGELPDIEIAYKDIIDPLLILAQEDLEISSQLFVALFTELYRKEEDHKTAQTYLLGLQDILSKTDGLSGGYNFVSTIHQALLEIQRRDDEAQIDPSIVTNSGLKSCSYYTAVLLLEEILIASASSNDSSLVVEKLKKPKILKIEEKQEAIFLNTKPKNTPQSSEIQLYLVEIYQAINDEDGAKGYFSALLDHEQVIQKALDLKMGQNYSESIKVFNEALNKYQPNSNNQKKLLEYLKEEKRESLAALNQWDIILKETEFNIDNNSGSTLIPIETLQEADAYYLMKGLIYNDEHWPTMNEYISIWKQNEKTKNLIENRYSWEIGLLAITQKDYDTAKCCIALEKDNFLQKWEKLDLFSDSAKHKYLSQLQKTQEFQEFLDYIDETKYAKDKVIAKEFDKLFEKWIQRAPSVAYDSVHAWNDIIFAREMFCNVISYQRFKESGGMFENKIVELYTESARGFYRKGVHESAEKLLNKVITIRKNQEGSEKRLVDEKAISLITKLKLKQLDLDENRLLCDIDVQLRRYDQILSVLNQQYQSETPKANFSLNKLCILVEEKSLDYLYERYLIAKGTNQPVNKILTVLTLCPDSIDKRFKTLLNDDQPSLQRGKIHFKYARFIEKLMQIHEEDPAIPSNSQNLAQSFIENICEAYRLGYFGQLQQLPRLISCLLKYKTPLNLVFKSKAADIPVWIFLKWLPQMMALICDPAVEDIFLKVAENYPQALIYPLNVFHNKIFQANNPLEKTKLVSKLLQKLAGFQNHYAFIQSLNQLIHPEHKLIHYYFEQIKEILLQNPPNKKEKLTLLGKDLWLDIFCYRKPFVCYQLGSYSSKFVEIWEKQFTSAFGFELEKVSQMTWLSYQNNSDIQKIIDRVKESKIGSGPEKISTFSTWLATYDSINYLYEPKIEIPGQYTHITTEPSLWLHMTITNFDQDAFILGSLRKPKKITMYGSDEKAYSFLVKGIEDLRLDQRVEQLFSVMNQIFLQDYECQKREIKINTFEVIPLTKSLGLIEWIDDTISLGTLLGKELENTYQKSGNFAEQRRGNWLNNLPECQGKRNSLEKHIVLLGLEPKLVIDNFNSHQALIPASLLKRSLETLVGSFGASIHIRNKFIRNYAALSVACYILGVGDRHLDNILLNIKTGEVVPIDFGDSFGRGLTLQIPELMPIRLTRVFENLMQPMGVDGIFRSTMIQCMNALKAQRNMILDCCEVFLKDPLVDWASMKKKKKEGKEEENCCVSSGKKEDEFSTKIKIEIVRKKLRGIKPSEIMLMELEESYLFKQPQFQNQREKITEAVQGGAESYRSTLTQHILDTSQQVDALIDQARDPNILGRAWIGWAPYI